MSIFYEINKKIKLKLGAKIMLYCVIFLLTLIIVTIIGSIVSRNYVYTPKFKDNKGTIIKDSIAEFERVNLNGYSHGILIRGTNINNPVLVYLHAGPGLSETGLMRKYNSNLENYYTMVYFDQRGAAKSYSPFMNSDTFNKEQLISDIHELTLYLKKKFNKEKIILMGHSFGAGFAALTASKYQDDYMAYIGIGQPVNPVESDKLSYSYTLQKAKNDKDEKAINELNKVNNFWMEKDKSNYFKGMMVLKKWVGEYGWQIHNDTGFMSFVLKNSLCSEFNIFDYPSFLLGMNFSGPASFEIMTQTDLRVEAKNFKAPFFILEGRYDYNTFPILVEEYYDIVDAPYKEMIWFENSAHLLNFEESKAFQDKMIDYILPIVLKGEKNKN